MKYIYILMLYFLVSYAYINSLSSLIIAGASVLLILLTYISLLKEQSSTSSVISLLCYTIPISFRNILGGEFADLPISWFYLLGIFYILIILLNNNKNITQKPIGTIGVILVINLCLGVIPFMTAVNKSDALGEFITYLFFLLMLFFSLFSRATLNEKEYFAIVKSYVFGCLFAATGVIIQYVMYTYFSVSLFRIEFYGLSRKYFSFMFYDMSSATLYMATGAIMLLVYGNNRRFFKLVLALIILISMALSSARAGLVSFMIVFLAYSLFTKGIIKKTVYIASGFLMAIGSLYFITKVRSLDSPLSYVTYDSGRVSGYLDGINYFLMSPLLGVGYDLAFLMNSEGLVIPHFAFLNMLAQTGVFITALYVITIIYICVQAYKKRLNGIWWCLILSLIGSCIIPGFFNSRFFTVLSILAILCDTHMYKSRLRLETNE